MHDGSPRRDALRLDRVVLRGVEDARPDPLRARQRLERTLAATDWTPAGLPPGALLFVRRLRVHGPGFDVGSGAASSGRDAFVDDRAFASRIADSLRAQGRAARRPWSDTQAVDADAVWFEDEDELVACLVRDWLRGLVAQRWWWRSVLAGAGIDVWLRTQLLSRGERLAPTLQRLAAVSLAAAWVARMDDADARIGIDALARAYALPHAHGETIEAMQDRSDQPDGPGQRVAMTPHALVQARISARSRLQRIVPELDAAEWRPSQARLLAYGLALLRAPAEARTRAFADDVAAWRPASAHAPGNSTTDHAVDAVIDESDDHCAVRDGITQASPSRPRAAAPARRPQSEMLHADADIVVPMARGGSRQQRVSSAVADSKIASGFVATRGDVGARDPQASTATPETVTTDATMPAIEPLSSAVDEPPPTRATANIGETAPMAVPVAVARTVSTSHGGLFYILNAALSLGVYGDFGSPRMRGIALSPWDLLAWLGLHWFGRAFRRDPLWKLLAELAGRSPRRAPSWRIDPPPRWEPGDDWLRAWAPMTALDHGVDRRAARLYVLHPDGFAVFDVPRQTRLRPAAQARALCLSREVAAHARLRHAATARARPADPGLRWLHCFADYLAARCMRALGTTSPRAAVALLCRHAADVRCDASHVDVALSLSTLPLPVRIAGLDRDPGWIPAAGRDIRFHFS